MPSGAPGALEPPERAAHVPCADCTQVLCGGAAGAKGSSWWRQHGGGKLAAQLPGVPDASATPRRRSPWLTAWAPAEQIAEAQHGALRATAGHHLRKRSPSFPVDQTQRQARDEGVAAVR